MLINPSVYSRVCEQEKTIRNMKQKYFHIGIHICCNMNITQQMKFRNIYLFIVVNKLLHLLSFRCRSNYFQTVKRNN